MKDIQCLIRRVATLSRFISKSMERCLPFYKNLKKIEDFQWIEECQRAFNELKDYLKKPSLISKPTLRETLYVYLSISLMALSLVLI